MLDFASIGAHWLWMIAGMILLALELAVSGFFFLWIGLAAIATAIVAAFVSLSWSSQLVFFSVTALVCVGIWWLQLKAKQNVPDEASSINNRGQSLIGREATLEEPIKSGRGHIRLDDTLWICEGLDCPKGVHIRVTGFSGNILKVEPVLN